MQIVRYADEMLINVFRSFAYLEGRAFRHGDIVTKFPVIIEIMTLNSYCVGRHLRGPCQEGGRVCTRCLDRERRV